MRTEQEIRDAIDSIHDEMEMLHGNPPDILAEYTTMMDELEHLENALRWVLCEKSYFFSYE